MIVLIMLLLWAGAGTLSLAQTPGQAVGARADARPFDSLAYLTSQRARIPVNYEDPVWVYEGDVANDFDTVNKEGKRLRFPIPRPVVLESPVTVPVLFANPAEVVEFLRSATGSNPNGPARFQVVSNSDGSISIVPTHAHSAIGAWEKVKPLLDYEVMLPAVTETSEQRFGRLCAELSKLAPVRVEAAPPMRFSGARDAVAWGLQSGAARKLLLDMLAEGGRPYSYHLLCQPKVSGAEGFCALNLTPLRVE